MPRRVRWLWRPALGAALAIAGAITIHSCGGSSSKSTNPMSGGGGVEINSGNLPPGGSFQHTFASAGTFPYHCTIHAAMTGNQVVVDMASGNDSALVQIVSMVAPGFSPSSVTIKPGGHVRWINVHTTTHTATSGS